MALHEQAETQPGRLTGTIVQETAADRDTGGSASTKVPAPTAPTVIEEDWSHHISPATADGIVRNERNSEESFSYYDTVLVPLGSGGNRKKSATSNTAPKDEPLVMEIRCMESLTPLDMMDLSNGLSDATGNRIWMGTVLFLECMVRAIDPTEAPNGENGRRRLLRDRQREALRDLRAELFRDKRVLELGSGTGAALIAIGLERETLNRPAFLALTDNDTNVLSLCQMNCNRNFRKHGDGSPNYAVGLLDWGDFCASTATNRGGTIADADAAEGDYQQQQQQQQQQQGNSHFFLDTVALRGTLDTVVANDVIYDTATIPRVFEVARGLLRHRGVFVLAHVPRASIDCELSRIREALEDTILAEARRCGFATDPSDGADSWEVLFRHAVEGLDETATGGGILEAKEGYGNHHETKARTMILRPSTLAKIFATNTISVSENYDYEELESCGASIMIFVKNHSNGKGTSEG